MIAYGGNETMKYALVNPTVYCHAKGFFWGLQEEVEWYE